VILNRIGCAKAAALAALLCVCWGSAQASPLISDDEAQRPNDSQTTPTRSITRGPTIRFEAPQGALVPHKPFDFRVRFDAHGGATIDPASVHITYLKMPNVDLTTRLHPYITAEGIDMVQAEVPAGEHSLKVDVQDSEGHTGEAVFTLNVPK